MVRSADPGAAAAPPAATGRLAPHSHDRMDVMTAFAAKGIVAAPVLPMLPDFSIDWDGLRSYLAWIAKQRPTAIAMNMDASEGPSLTRDEMLEVVRVSREAIDGACPLVS